MNVVSESAPKRRTLPRDAAQILRLRDLKVPRNNQKKDSRHHTTYDYHAKRHRNNNTNSTIVINTFQNITITIMSSPPSSSAITKVDLSHYNIKKIASGKVREIFEIDEKTLLFVATDRISAYDVILDNVSWSYLFLRLFGFKTCLCSCCLSFYSLCFIRCNIYLIRSLFFFH